MLWKKLWVIGVFFLLQIACSNQIEIKGALTNQENRLSPGMLVRLLVVSDNGTEIAELDRKLTDAKGEFEFRIDGEVSSYVITEAITSTETLRGFAAGNHFVGNVNPVSNSLVQAILNVTAPEGERTLADFSLSELWQITKVLEDNIDLSSINLKDEEALLDRVVQVLGRLIPEAAGGEIQVQASNSFDPSDQTVPAPSLSSSIPCSRQTVFVEGDLFQFDLTESGALCNVNGVETPLTDAFDIGFELSIVGDTFTDTGNGFFPGDLQSGDPARTIEDEREYVFGPVSTTTGLQITRKVYIPEGEDLVRYLDIFQNPTTSDKTISIQLSGEYGLGSISNPPVILADSSGDRSANELDDWAVVVSTELGNKNPTVGILWNAQRTFHRADTVLVTPSNPNAFLLRWSDVTIPASATRTISIFARVMTSLSSDEGMNQMLELFRSPDFSTMNSTELTALENLAPTRGNVTGEAGSVMAGASVTVTNESTGTATTVTAGKDGSFAVLLSASSGQSIQVSSTDGYFKSFTIP